MKHRVRPVLLGLALGALGGGCSRPEPSRTPLSASAAPTTPPARRSFSRANDSTEQKEEPQEIEVNAGGDDDDADSTRLPTSSRASPAGAVSSRVSPASSTSVAGSGCSVAAGPAPDCGTLAAAGGCLGAALARRACETLGPAVDARVGAAWLACMRAPADAAAACDSHRIVECGLRAISAACVDGSFAGTCADIAASCADVAPEITGPVCEHLLGAWKPSERPKMLECLRHGCETGGFGACLP